MRNGLRIVGLDKSPKAVQKFFESLGDEPVLIEQEGRAVYLIQPADAVVPTAVHTQGPLAGEVLKHVQGAWTGLLPDEVCQQIAEGNR